MENTKHLKQKQKEYEEWRTSFLEELDNKLNEQAEKFDCVETQLAEQGGKLDSLLIGINQMSQSCVL
eukprot:4336774-Ditylum_brightwellii.AAC.1